MRAAFAAALPLLLAAEPLTAHGLLMKLRGTAEAVTGELYYSNGRRAAGEWIEMRDLTAPQGAAATVQTAEDGSFRIPGRRGHRYRVTATGEEGHVVEMLVRLAPDARGTLADGAAAAPDEVGALPPAWQIVGGLLLLSAIPALLIRRRDRGTQG